MLKRLTAILLILALSFQFLIKIGVVGYYIVNQNYITQAFCINKNKPELECNGKCHLSKQLAKQEQQANKFPSSVKEIQETILFFESPVLIANPSFPTQQNSQLPPYAFSISINKSHSIFHPPQNV